MHSRDNRGMQRLTVGYPLYILGEVHDSEAAFVSVTISRWGNSFGVRIPKAALEEANLQEGDRVDIVAKNRQLVIVKSRRRSLEELVAQMTPENSHPETFDTPVGNEVL